MTGIEKNSLIDRVLGLLADLKGTPRALTRAEEQIIADLLFHPDMPRFFSTKQSAPKSPRVEKEAA